MKKLFSVIFAVFLLFFENAFSSSSNWQENEISGAKTKFLASFYQDDSDQKKLIAGIHFKISDGWKIYGNDSGGIGMPPSVDFSESNNITNFKIFWPKAQLGEEQIGDETIKYSFYKDEIILPIAIDLEKLSQINELKVHLDYGLCKDICIPASENFSIQISDKIDEESLAKIQEFVEFKISNSVSVKNAKPKTLDSSPTLIYAILLAIIGGAILNIMPCVLPVLSIKLLSIIKHSEAPIARIRFAFLATILGILFCFISFAAIAAIIKLTGDSLGWGLQFQNPYFLISLIIILVLFLGNLLGIFEINFDQFLATILNRKIANSEKKKNIFIPNFLSGILAVMLATPCSAPFLGSAISFALTQSFLIIFIIFIFIGLGFSLPYILLLASPKLVYFLPKTGKWTIQIKQLMAGLLAATIIWLIYVLVPVIGAFPAFLAGAFAISLLAAIKIRFRFLKYTAILLIIICSFALPSNLRDYQRAQEALWQDFDESKISQYVADGKIVIVDITADWCLSCKFNKIRVLQNKEVIEKLKSEIIIPMRGDITKPNETITKYLHKNNRFAIPFNAVYGPKVPEGILTSEFLTKKELFELIEKAQ